MLPVKKIAAILAVSFSAVLQPIPLRAGGGIIGGALEVTQLANHAELMAQVAEASQQTAQQINMLATMMQNLQSLTSLSGIASQLGIPVGNLQSFIDAYGSVATARMAVMNIKDSFERLGTNSNSMATFYGTLANRLGDTIRPGTQITTQEIQDALRAMDEERVRRARLVMQQRLRTIDEMNNDYKYIMDNASEIRQITGNVQGLQFLATQQSGIQRLLMDTRMSIESLNASLAEQRLESAEREELEKEIGRRMLERSLNRFF